MAIDLQARTIEPQRLTYHHVAKYIGEGKMPSRYEEATMGAQPMVNFHYRPSWDPDHELFDASRTKVVMSDWYKLRDPRQFYYASWTMTRARQQETMEANHQFVESRGLVDKMPAELREAVCRVLMPLRHVAWGGNMNNSFVCGYGYGTALTAPAMMHALDHLGVAQYLTRLGLTLEGPDCLDAGRQVWLQDPAWQPLRRYVEDMFVVQDPFELFVAQNLALDGLLYPLIYGAYVDDHVAMKGGTAVAMLTAFMTEWFDESARWIDAVVKTAVAESDANKNTIGQWVRDWAARAESALAPVASQALGAVSGAALSDVRREFDARLNKIGLA
ncbi:MAG: aromatic/alkene monooxygenase hydroxylase subunit beta [Rhodoferax sp.]